MGRVGKQKRLLIEESNRKLMGEDTVNSSYVGYGTNVMSIANKFSGGGYKWEGVSGVCIPLKHNDKIIRSYDEGGPSHCCGFTLSIAFIAATNRGLLESKTEKEVSKFSSEWYSAGGKDGKLCVTALENLSIGKEVSLENAQEGDFCQLWRTNGSGHSVIFESHIYDGDIIIGFNYRSSQKSTDGIGSSKEYFSDSNKGKVSRGVTYFGRMNH
tara:strand:- start:157 stop:795 length:639 start_codon:yes stop_codon:yes gene_type:complete